MSVYRDDWHQIGLFLEFAWCEHLARPKNGLVTSHNPFRMSTWNSPGNLSREFQVNSSFSSDTGIFRSFPGIRVGFKNRHFTDPSEFQSSLMIVEFSLDLPEISARWEGVILRHSIYHKIFFPALALLNLLKTPHKWLWFTLKKRIMGMMDFWLPPVKACTKPKGLTGDIAADNLSSKSFSASISLVWTSPLLSL